jgi:hypothetical protein
MDAESRELKRWMHLGLDTPTATELLVPRLLPLCYQADETAGSVRDRSRRHVYRGSNALFVCIILLEEPVVQFLGNGIPLVVQLINITCPRVVNAEDRPDRLVLALALVTLVFGISHLPLVVFQDVLYLIKA